MAEELIDSYIEREALAYLLETGQPVTPELLQVPLWRIEDRLRGTEFEGQVKMENLTCGQYLKLINELLNLTTPENLNWFGDE